MPGSPSHGTDQLEDKTPVQCQAADITETAPTCKQAMQGLSSMMMLTRRPTQSMTYPPQPMSLET